MIFLLIIADDFTGALDTGVQFAARGIETRVVVGAQADLAAHEAKVLVIDTETRHLPAAEAYRAVYRLTLQAKKAGVRYLYKKTDSALRGNIGAELSAVLDAGGRTMLPFLPAYPQIGRVTRGGVHYIDGVPVKDSPFGADPFAPVRHSVVTELIAEQADRPARSFAPLRAGKKFPDWEGILVFDAENAGDLLDTGRRLLDRDALTVSAGCAGFAAVLPELLGLAGEAAPARPRLDPRLLVVCGSVNPITLAQMDAAERAGFTRLRLTPRQKLEPNHWQTAEGAAELKEIERTLAAHPHCILETNDRGGNRPTAEYAARLGLDTEALRVRIAGGLGALVGALFTSPALGTLLLTGGDTLLQCMECIGARELEPLCELEKGVVLASFTYQGCTRHVITKSGGFGREDLFIELAAHIAQEDQTDTPKTTATEENT